MQLRGARTHGSLTHAVHVYLLRRRESGTGEGLKCVRGSACFESRGYSYTTPRVPPPL
jgi:hypothetical protein